MFSRMIIFAVTIFPINLKKMFMKKVILSIALSLITPVIFGQVFLNVLFVNDNKINTSNTNVVLSNLGAVTGGFDIFNAVDSLRGPTFDELSQYNFVIWYCSSDGVGLNLWNGNDTDNENLKMWLDVYPYAGLWLMGTDILYDRWSAPSLFNAGDFVYDYLGLQEYHAQSYGDDGGLGVARLDNTGLFGQMNFTPVQWQFPTAWWVDACLPSPNAFPLYSMGPEGYLFDDYCSAIVNLQSPTTPRITYFFDPALMDSDANMQYLFEETFWYITNLITAIDDQPSPRDASLSLSPNPATGLMKISFPQPETIRQITVYNTLGKAVIQNIPATPQIDVAPLAPGVYLLTAETERGTVASRFVKR